MTKNVSYFFCIKHFGRYQYRVDKYLVITYQIIHDVLEVKILSTDVVRHLNYVLHRSFLCKALLQILLEIPVWGDILYRGSVLIHPVIVLLLYGQYLYSCSSFLPLRFVCNILICYFCFVHSLLSI